jgi:drug/metabolite transporter (DMT)-like permease
MTSLPEASRRNEGEVPVREPARSIPEPIRASDPAVSVGGGKPWVQVLAFAAVYLIWGSTYLAIRVAVETLPPFLMAGSRFVLAGGILYALLRALGVAQPSPAEWRHAAVAGLLMLTVGNGLVTWAEETVPSNLTALLVSAVPLYVAVLDWLRPGGQRPRLPVLVGVAVGLGGMALLVIPERGAVSVSMGGVVAVLVAGLGWALGSLYARYAVRHRHPVMAAAQQMIAGGLVQLAIAVVRGDIGRFHPAAIGWKGLAAFGYLTLLGSVVGFSAFGYLVVASTPARLSTTAYVNPVIAVVLGWLVLGETLGARALAGAALIVASVVVMTVGGRAARAKD